MSNERVYTLVPSTNRGRYALDDPQGYDLTTHQSVSLLLGGSWTLGRVEHSHAPTKKYPDVAGLSHELRNEVVEKLIAG
jgi:hypothetical protein